ncbi:RPT6A [Symbiodinium natans]|uniref:RPT6A protein n=1 Tax=Symbiodinium natans TaxID=878477 RepID=A0A812TQQ9_9DINO|nr:RPT6A [Symbiodinium natans]
MLPWTEWASDNSMCASTRTARAEPKTLDAAAFCTPDSFVDVANQCLVWQCLPVGLHVELPALEAAVTDAPLPLPFFVDDEDMLQDLLNAEPSSSSRQRNTDEDAIVPRAEAQVSVSCAKPLNRDEKALLAALLEQGAVGDHGCDALSLHTYNAQAAGALREAGYVSTWEGDFGELVLAVTETGRVSPQLDLSSPLRLRDMPSEGHSGFRTGQCKLEWLRLLLQHQWQYDEQCPEWHDKDAALLLPQNALSRPEAYLKCMLCLSVVWNKPGAPARILHQAPELYYKYLLHEPDLSFLQEWGKADIMGCSTNRRQGRQPKKRAKAGVGALTAAAALADKEDSDSDDAGPLRGRRGLREEAALPLPDRLVPPPVRSQVPGVDVTIYFDNYTHSSGNLRAFVECKRHKKCRLYVFVNKHESRSHAVAYLLAWHQLGSRFASAATHIAEKPSGVEVHAHHWAQLRNISARAVLASVRRPGRGLPPSHDNQHSGRGTTRLPRLVLACRARPCAALAARNRLPRSEMPAPKAVPAPATPPGTQLLAEDATGAAPATPRPEAPQVPETELLAELANAAAPAEKTEAPTADVAPESSEQIEPAPTTPALSEPREGETEKKEAAVPENKGGDGERSPSKSPCTRRAAEVLPEESSSSPEMELVVTEDAAQAMAAEERARNLKKTLAEKKKEAEHRGEDGQDETDTKDDQAQGSEGHKQRPAHPAVPPKGPPPKPRAQNNTNTGQDPKESQDFVECKFCWKKVSRWGLENHQASSNHCKWYQDRAGAKPEPQRRSQYTCDVCEKDLGDERALHQHKKSVHGI